jgi:ATP/maltotriose-dependent transcriptional regulator MalT
LLEKSDFRRNVEIYNESFHPGTREWLSKKVDRWFQQRDSNSQVMILTADAGFGKSTFAGQVCKEYKERDQLKACHFFKSTISAYSDPRKMLESLASQLCENVSGFKEKLAAQLQRKPLLTTIGDAFRVFLKDPLNSLPDEKSSILIVIDGLDESVSGEKNNFFGCNR